MFRVVSGSVQCEGSAATQHYYLKLMLQFAVSDSKLLLLLLYTVVLLLLDLTVNHSSTLKGYPLGQHSRLVIVAWI